MTPFETVVVLLEWFRDVRDGQAEGGDRADRRTSRTLQFHEWWHEGSFRDLERMLGDMRRFRRDRVFDGYPVIELRQHIDWWYLDVCRKAAPVLRPVRRHGKVVGHVPTGLFAPRLVRHPSADRERAEAGVRFLVAEFKARGVQPRLPVELWRIVSGAPEKAA